MTSADEDNETPVASEGNDPFVGRVFNERFRVISLIARGGLGAVYRAEQAPLGRICAIKILRPRYEETSPDEFNKRFFLEASIASKLTHPNNVTLYDYGHTHDDIYFMAMELLEGKTLARTIRTEGPLNEERATHVARQVCRALREAHSLGVIHRDIKPGNIFLTQKHDEPDFVKVMDFGLVKDINLQDDGLTKAGVFMGSPKYMSPEQIQGQFVDARTDIYALGVVLFEMVTGKTPFDRQSSVQTLIAHLNEDVPALKDAYPECSISPHMEQVIYRCIAKSPDQRFASTDEVLLALKGFTGATATATISTVSGSYGAMSTTGSSSFSQLASSKSGPHVFMAGQSTSDGITPSGVAASRRAGKAKKQRLVVGGLGAVVAIGAVVAAAFLLGNKGRSESSLAIAAPPQPDPAPVVSDKPAASAPEPIAKEPIARQPIASASAPTLPPLHVTTAPEGAMVRLGHGSGTKLCKSTPCDIPRADLPEGDVVLYIVKDGYVITTEKAKDGADKVEVRLIPTGRPEKPAEPAPKSYKTDPYD